MNKNYISYFIGILILSFTLAACSSDDKHDPIDKGAQEVKEQLYGYWEFAEGDISSISFKKDEKSADVYKLTKEDKSVVEGKFSVVEAAALRATVAAKSYQIILDGFGQLDIVKVDDKGLVVTHDDKELEATPEDEPEIPSEVEYELGFIIAQAIDQDTYRIVLVDAQGVEITAIDTLSGTQGSESFYDILNFNEKTNTLYYEGMSADSLNTAIYSMNIDTRGRELVTTIEDYYENLVISKDGKIVYHDVIHSEPVEGQDGNRETFDIIKKTVTGGAVEKLITNTDKSIDELHTSADGSILLYLEEDLNAEDVASKIFTIGKDKKVTEIIAFEPDIINNLGITADGRMILASADYKIYTANIDGSNNKQVVDEGKNHYIESLYWSADAKYIYYDNYRKENVIHRLDVAAGTSSIISEDFPIASLYNISISVKILKRKDK